MAVIRQGSQSTNYAAAAFFTNEVVLVAGTRCVLDRILIDGDCTLSAGGSITVETAGGVHLHKFGSGALNTADLFRTGFEAGFKSDDGLRFTAPAGTGDYALTFLYRQNF